MFYNNKFKKIRKSKKINQRDLAEAMGKASFTVSRWESGMNIPSDNDVRILAQILNVSVKDISDLGELKILGDNINGSGNSEKVSIHKHIIELDQMIKEYGDIPIININAIENLKTNYRDSKKKINFLKQKLNNYTTILNEAPVIIYVKNVDLKYLYANNAFLLCTDKVYNIYDVIGLSASEIFGYKESKKILKYEKEALNNKNSVNNIKIPIPGTNGNKTGSLNISPQFDNKGNVKSLICIIKETTEINKVLGKLKNLRNIIDKLDEFITIKYQDNSSNMFLSKGFEKVTGYEIPDYFKDTNLWEQKIILPEDKNILKFDTITKLPIPGVYKYRIKHKNGSIKWIEDIIYVGQEQIKHNSFMYSITRDITKEIEHNEMMELLEINVNAMTSGISIVVTEKNNHKKLVYTNEAIKKITGYSEEFYTEDIPIFWLDKAVHPDYRKELELALNIDSIPSSFEFKIIRKDGIERWVELKRNKIKFRGKISTLNILSDITKKKEKENIRELLESLLSTVNDGVSIVDLDKHKNIFVNDTAAEITGYNINKFLEKDLNFWLNNVLDPKYRDIVKKRISSGKSHSMEYQITKAEGESRWIKSDISFKKFNDTNCYIAIERDITEDLQKNELLKLLEVSVNTIDTGLAIIDTSDNKILYINKAFENITEYTADFFYNYGLGVFSQKLIYSEDRLRYIEELKNDRFRKVTNIRFAKKDGTIVKVEIKRYKVFYNGKQYKANFISKID